MKLSTLFSIVLLAATAAACGSKSSSQSAVQDQATDNIDGAVTCTAVSGDFKVKISKDRSKMTITKASGSSESYEVNQESEDVDTWYAPASGYPELDFNDEGDAIYFNKTDKGVSLNCPQ
jgi:hypothetical protein